MVLLVTSKEQALARARVGVVVRQNPGWLDKGNGWTNRLKPISSLIY